MAAETPTRTQVLLVAATAALIITAATALRVYGLGVHELWLDEAFSFNTITSPDWLAIVRISEPPLYPLLLRTWSAAVGTDEASLRLLSAVIGTAFVMAVMWAGWELFDRTVALWSGVVAATSPIQVYYSQEARAYALLTFVLVVTYVLLARALRTNGWGRWALVALAMAAGPYTHYLAPLALGPTVAMVLLAHAPGRLPRYCLAVGAAMLLYAPWFVWSFVVTPHSFGGLDWVHGAWEDTPPRWAIPKSLEVLYLGPHEGFLPIRLKVFDSFEIPTAVRAVGLATLCALGAWIAGPWSARQGEGRRVAALWVLLLAPLVLLAAISLGQPLYIVGRYDQLALPAFPLLAGVGLARLGSLRRWGRALSAVAAGALLVPVGVVLIKYYQSPLSPTAKSRRAAAALATRVHDGDVVLLSHPRGLPILYQLLQLGYRVRAGSCERHSPQARFACWLYPRPLGPVLTGEDMARVADRADVVGADLDTVYLPPLAGPERDVFLVVGAHGKGTSGLMVSVQDRLLLLGLKDRGFAPVTTDEDLGVVQLRRAR